MRSIIFIGISGVLMPEHHWDAPENAAALVARCSGTWTGTLKAIESVHFDANCVRRLVELIDTEQAKVVLSSQWRNKVGPTREGGRRLVYRLVSQGIPASSFHNDAVVPWRSIREPQPLHDIRLWLARHSHVQPEGHSYPKLTSSRFIRACARVGFPFITLDTDDWLPNVVLTDQQLGLTDDAVSRARRALRVQRDWLAASVRRVHMPNDGM